LDFPAGAHGTRETLECFAVVYTSKFTTLWRKVQDVQNRVAEDSIKKRVTQEKSPLKF
jgi:hypothetical protein